MVEWKNIYRGLAMGTSDVIPGVSGGTIAVVLGIYDRLIAAISGIFSKEWKKHLGFLIPLGVGVVGALLLFSHLVDWLLANYPQPTNFFFLGLIIGVLPFLLKKAEVKKNFRTGHYFMFVVAAILCASLVFFKPDEAAAILDSLSMSTIFILFFSGWLASMAMLLPGISGSFVLLIIGIYPSFIAALKDLNIPVLMVIGSGIVVGLIVSSKLIRYSLEHFPSMTYAAIIGLVIGSTVVIFPGFASDMTLLLLSIGSFALGLAAAVGLGAYEYKEV
ncbi:DUF368 domain-containing protein [Bacillaceae bacterium S4-13-56]